MATIPIPAGTREAQCRSCGKPGYWVKTERGKWLLVEVNTAVDPRCAVPMVDRWGQGIAHFATCPEATSWRTKPRRHHLNQRPAR